MRKEINLLEATEITPNFEEQKQKKGMITSITIIVIFVIIIISVFAYTIYLQGKINSLSEKVSAKEQQIEKIKDRETMYRLIKSKIKGADQIISKRPDLVPVLDILQNATPKGIIFDNILLPVEDKISLTGKAIDSSVLGEFFSTLSEKDFKKYFRQVTLNSLTYSKGKGYSFDIFILLVLKEIK